MNNADIQQSIQQSIQNFTIFYKGSMFRQYAPMTQKNVPSQWTGGFCATYKLERGNKSYAYRVPSTPKKIDNYRRDVINFLSNLSSPYFAKFGLEEKSLLVEGKFLDVTYMEWIEGKIIGDYIKDNHKNSRLISELAEKFKDLILWLYENDISHGDLNDSNIMVKPNGDLVLIDYDTLCFADIDEEYDETSPGKADYQHPSRMNRCNKISIDADYFSALVIYISLVALSLDADLYRYFSAGNNMLFAKADFLDLTNSKVYKDLSILAERSSKLESLTSLLHEWCCYHISDFDDSDEGYYFDGNDLIRLMFCVPMVKFQSENLHIGDMVIHTKFGSGKILRLSEYGRKIIAEIFFIGRGKKILDLRIAQIRKASDENIIMDVCNKTVNELAPDVEQKLATLKRLYDLKLIDEGYYVKKSNDLRHDLTNYQLTESECNQDSYCINEGSMDNNDLYYDKSIQFIIETKCCSISALQTKFGIGYNRAVRIMNKLEETGAIKRTNRGTFQIADEDGLLNILVMK